MRKLLVVVMNSYDLYRQVRPGQSFSSNQSEGLALCKAAQLAPDREQARRAGHGRHNMFEGKTRSWPG